MSNTSEPTLPTEPLRAEHRDLLPHLRGLETVADEVDRWDADEAAHVLGDIVGFLRGHLVPHARAEEQVLYPAVEEAMAAPGATATMRADHAEIVSRIDRLADTAAIVATRWPDDTLARDLTHQFVGLSAILLLHFRKEEVLLPVLDTTPGPDDAAALFARMGQAATVVCRSGSAGWWSWTISPHGVSWPCSNCVTIFTRTTWGDDG